MLEKKVAGSLKQFDGGSKNPATFRQGGLGHAYSLSNEILLDVATDTRCDTRKRDRFGTVAINLKTKWFSSSCLFSTCCSRFWSQSANLTTIVAGDSSVAHHITSMSRSRNVNSASSLTKSYQISVCKNSRTHTHTQSVHVFMKIFLTKSELVNLNVEGNTKINCIATKTSKPTWCTTELLTRV